MYSIFWLRFFDTGRELHNFKKSFGSYYANNTTTFGISRGQISISQHHVGPNFSPSWSDPSFSPSWSDPNFNCLPLRQTPQLSVYMAKLSCFSKSSNSQDYRFRAWCHSHYSPIFYLGFIMIIVIVISFAKKRKTVPNVCAPELRAE